MNLSADLLDAISNKKYSLKKVEPPMTLGKNENLNSKNLKFDTIVLPVFSIQTDDLLFTEFVFNCLYF